MAPRGTQPWRASKGGLRMLARVSPKSARDGVDGLAEVAVELALKLASALERIAVEQGLVAVDLAEVWFVD